MENANLPIKTARGGFPQPLAVFGMTAAVKHLVVARQEKRHEEFRTVDFRFGVDTAGGLYE
jgi:hypothetical protein